MGDRRAGDSRIHRLPGMAGVVRSSLLLTCAIFALTGVPAPAQDTAGTSSAGDDGTATSLQQDDGDGTSTDSESSASTTTTSINESAPVPPEKFLKSPGGVDMRSGELLYSHTDLAIGGDQGLQLTRRFSPISLTHLTPGDFGGFTHNWDIRVNEKRVSVASASNPSEYDYQVSVFGSRANTFRQMWPAQPDGFVAQLEGGGYAWLTYEADLSGNPTRYTYRDSNGERIEFRTTGGAVVAPADRCGDKCAYAYLMVDPDGTTYTLSYDSAGSPVAYPRLRSVRSNRGYALLFEYVGGGASQISKVCALNLAYTIMPAISGELICPAGVPASTYTYTSGALSAFVDQAAVSTSIGPNGSTLYWPGESTPYVTNSITLNSACGNYVTSQAFADGRTYTYSWVLDGNTPNSCIMGGSYTLNAKTVTTQFGKYRHNLKDPTWYITVGPEAVTDEINRTWTYNYGCSGTGYCNPLALQKATSPEGDFTLLTYGSYNNITGTRQVAKPATGLSDIVTSATYPSSCTIFCSKPLTTTDANGHVTNYSYDATHGGLLTQMGPAPVTNGARPLTVNTYAPRYAWTKNSSGVLVQETVPVWTLSTSTACQTVAGTNPSPVCDGAAQQTVTTYQYGAANSAESLLVKGVAVASGGTTQRTCYSYDPYSRKISETRANANLATCP